LNQGPYFDQTLNHFGAPEFQASRGFPLSRHHATASPAAFVQDG
jgi:hypothetical protein